MLVHAGSDRATYPAANVLGDCPCILGNLLLVNINIIVQLVIKRLHFYLFLVWGDFCYDDSHRRWLAVVAECLCFTYKKFGNFITLKSFNLHETLDFFKREVILHGENKTHTNNSWCACSRNRRSLSNKKKLSIVPGNFLFLLTRRKKLHATEKGKTKRPSVDKVHLLKPRNFHFVRHFRGWWANWSSVVGFTYVNWPSKRSRNKIKWAKRPIGPNGAGTLMAHTTSLASPYCFIEHTLEPVHCLNDEAWSICCHGRVFHGTLKSLRQKSADES
jgi:hypothetical protein